LTLRVAFPAGIRFEKVEKRYGGLYALRRVSLEVAPGECVVLAGRNGSGKTTLLRIAARLVKPSGGIVSYSAADSGSGERGDEKDSDRVRPGFVAHATMVYDELTAEENLLLFARLQGVPRSKERVAAMLEEVSLTDRRKSLVRTFSRGMRQRVAIARALLTGPSVLLLDEPATGLDSQGIGWLAQTLRGMRDAGCTLLMSLHGESEISALATRGIRLDSGAVVGDTQTGVAMNSVLVGAGE
jgi:ABC-type multidrug transport system ATPase subunit